MRALVVACALSVVAGSALAAPQLDCRVLYRLSCSPDLCLPPDADPMQPLGVRIVLAEDGRTLTYTENGKSKTASVTVKDLGDGYRVIGGGTIDWPAYAESEGDPGRNLGRVNMVMDGMFFTWRVTYLGNKADVEEEDVLYGDCIRP